MISGCFLLNEEEQTDQSIIIILYDEITKIMNKLSDKLINLRRRMTTTTVMMMMVGMITMATTTMTMTLVRQRENGS